MNPFFGSTNTNMFSDFDFLSNDQQQRQEVVSSAEEDFYHSRPVIEQQCSHGESHYYRDQRPDGIPRPPQAVSHASPSFQDPYYDASGRVKASLWSQPQSHAPPPSGGFPRPGHRGPPGPSSSAAPSNSFRRFDMPNSTSTSASPSVSAYLWGSHHTTPTTAATINGNSSNYVQHNGLQHPPSFSSSTINTNGSQCSHPSGAHATYVPSASWARTSSGDNGIPIMMSSSSNGGNYNRPLVNSDAFGMPVETSQATMWCSPAQLAAPSSMLPEMTNAMEGIGMGFGNGMDTTMGSLSGSRTMPFVSSEHYGAHPHPPPPPPLLQPLLPFLHPYHQGGNGSSNGYSPSPSTSTPLSQQFPLGEDDEDGDNDWYHDNYENAHEGGDEISTVSGPRQTSHIRGNRNIQGGGTDRRSRNSTPSGKSFPCPQCGREYLRAQRQEACMNKHRGIKPYRCDGKCETGKECEKAFYGPEDLRRHQRPIESKKWVCPDCHQSGHLSNKKRHESRCRVRGVSSLFVRR
ncbi:hypothetical protein FRB91_009543 [Serendipita sp. 411]|nr:hypothetical protein FRC18_000021 [Serendipita sp. 400]KAG8849884.1 hypothetical protein FRB91_009543 [Serendipita sp. 411]